MDNETIISNLNSPREFKDASNIDEWFLVGSYLQCFLVLASYFAFVLKIGPSLMKDRTPFKLTNIILIYNIFQILLSGYIFKVGVNTLSLAANKCISDSEELQYEYYYVAHVYLVAKLLELLDTVFFVLRKKDRQVSFLHLYHHSTIFLYTWAVISFKYIVLSLIVLGLLNSFVHIIMYSYYAVAAFPSISKYIWWKKYITTMQIIQFVLILMYAFYEYLTSPCKIDTALLYHIAGHVCFVTYLFVDFYIKTYKSESSEKKQH